MREREAAEAHRAGIPQEFLAPAHQPSYDEMFGLAGGASQPPADVPWQPTPAAAPVAHQAPADVPWEPTPAAAPVAHQAPTDVPWEPNRAEAPVAPEVPANVPWEPTPAPAPVSAAEWPANRAPAAAIGGPEQVPAPDLESRRPRRPTNQMPSPVAVPAASAHVPVESVDVPVDESPAFDAAESEPFGAGGFDALFAGLGDDASDASRGVGARREERRQDTGSKSPKSPKPSRTARKAAKSAVGPRRGAPVPAPERDGTSAADDFAAAIAAAAGARPPLTEAASAATPAAVHFERPSATPAAVRFEEPLPAAVPEYDPVATGDGREHGTSWQPSTGMAPAADQRSRRAPATSAGAGRGNSARGVAASSGPRPAPPSRVKRSSRARRMASGFAAMGFAALLAVATSVPSLSLLSPAEVQAMALERATIGTEPGQHVEITGGTLAQTINREGYETQTIDEYARAAGIRAEATFTNNPAGTIQWPFAVGVHIGDEFGYRDCAGCSSDHGGQDFNPGLGAEIQSIADGVVSNSTDSGGSLGVVMMIDHVIDGDLITSVYAHMEYDSRRFQTGDTVKVGDVIGNTGDTGMSTGPHLHFEIRIGGINGMKVDPLDWLYENTN